MSGLALFRILLSAFCLFVGSGAFFLLLIYGRKSGQSGWKILSGLILILILQCINLGTGSSFLLTDGGMTVLVIVQSLATVVNAGIVILVPLLLFSFSMIRKPLFAGLLAGGVGLFLAQTTLNILVFSAFVRQGTFPDIPPITNLFFFLLLGISAMLFFIRLSSAPIEFREYLKSILPLFLTLFPFLIGDIYGRFISDPDRLSPFQTGLMIYFFALFTFTAYHFFKVLTVSEQRTGGVQKGAVSDHERFGLSPREAEVLELMLKGKKNQQIAEELYISLATVKSHTNHIFQKTTTSNRLELFTLLRLGR